MLSEDEGNWIPQSEVETKLQMVEVSFSTLHFNERFFDQKKVFGKEYNATRNWEISQQVGC